MITFFFRTIVLLTIFSQVLTEVNIPGITYNRDRGLQIVWFKIFKLFPVGILLFLFLPMDYDL